MNLGGAEIIVILIVALIVFGPKRLPEIGRQVGSAIRELRNVEHRVKSEISQALDLEPHPSEATGDNRAPFYGDPTNVPDQPEPERERVGQVDDHDQPLPIALEEEPDASSVATSTPGAPAPDADDEQPRPS